jgi:hypothetical protein
MGLDTARAFFMWCTIIDGALLVFSFLVCAFAGDWIYRIHRRLFPIPRESFNVVIYASIGLLKLLFFVFNVVPFVALSIVG